MKLTRRTVVQAVVEDTYAEDPGSGYQALLTNTGAEITPEGEGVVREVLRDTLSPLGGEVTQKRFSLTLPMEIRGAGLDGSTLQTPELDATFKAAAFQREAGADLAVSGVTGDFTIGEQVTNTTATETVGTVADWDAGNNRLYIRDLQNMPAETDALTGDDSGAEASVSTANEAYVYRPRSDIENMESATFRFYMDKIRHPVRGARASIALTLASGQYGVITPAITGLYTRPSDNDNPVVVYNPTKPERVQNAKVSIGGYDLSGVAVREMSFTGGVSLTNRNDVQADDGLRSVEVTAREPTGSVTLDKDTIAKMDPWSDWELGALIHIAYGYGSAAGKRFRVVHPNAQITGLTNTDQDGVAGFSIEFTPTGDDDETMIIYS